MDLPTNQERQWVHKGSPSLKKAKNQFSARNMVATVSWDAKGLVLIEYMSKESTITANVYQKIIKAIKILKTNKTSKIKENIRASFFGLKQLYINAYVHPPINLNFVLFFFSFLFLIQNMTALFMVNQKL